MPDQTVAKFSKPNAFYDTFDRKGAGDKVTHYCPGCGHGTIQKLIADCIDELEIQDRTVFLSPVGCSVFSYYYYDTGNIQCSHGRAPAVATGVRRTLPEAVIISYQGDGDLAGIGMTEIVHAANRGENITVVFVNNAIYGMTGGQMAPTTPMGQKTPTSPFGREVLRDGRPIGMAELIASLSAPVYVERCSVATAKDVLKTRKTIRKGLQNQVDHLGFSFIEILSPCPTNWGMDAVESRVWMQEQLNMLFPLGVYKDITTHLVSVDPGKYFSPLGDHKLRELLLGVAEVPVQRSVPLPQTQLIKVAGFGGQGVLSAGELLATCGMSEGIQVSWLPSYGPEMRGGSANVSVILSEDDIGSPLVDHPNVFIAMNGPSLDAFEDVVAPGGLILVNSAIVTRKVNRTDVRAVYIPATEIARQEGLLSAANVVMVTAYLIITKAFSIETLRRCIPLVLRKKAYLNQNLALVEKVLQWSADTHLLHENG
ncbi:MAG: 2-ketoisovalerate ferredoxin oxidoreductase [Spirochaetae bacterium HGW-Spirochaetae-8]|nr:MAG: 2-ketoisovalerate ferredoxin oxidoreductase [Spirochaetae bacterium HGW-Spirochaetae-8]